MPVPADFASATLSDITRGFERRPLIGVVGGDLRRGPHDAAEDILHLRSAADAPRVHLRTHALHPAAHLTPLGLGCLAELQRLDQAAAHA